MMFASSFENMRRNNSAIKYGIPSTSVVIIPPRLAREFLSTYYGNMGWNIRAWALGLTLGSLIPRPMLFVNAANLRTPVQIGSSVTQLFHNNLNWTDDSNHPGFLLLGTPVSYVVAKSGCATLGESLLTTLSAQVGQSDLAPELAYALYRDGHSPTQQYWLSDGTVTVSADGLLWYSEPSSIDITLSAICTQSASGTTDANSFATSTNGVNVTSISNGNTYVGFRNLKSFRFLGIPYADNPARWAYSSVSTTQGAVVNATAFGDACWQSASLSMSEDCLFLNIFMPYLPSPNDSPSQLRPVLFFIHGGGFTEGTGADPTFDGGNLASRGDVVVVTINYRLTTLGFLAIPGTNVTGNYGIADQITALQWVQANIQTFGGDPSQVTIAGQSAGAASVRALIASPKARGLFAGAIASSSPGGYNSGTTYALYRTLAQEYSASAQYVISAAGCTSNDTVQEVACLNALSGPAIIALSHASASVIVDGTYITSSQLNVTTPGEVAYVPVLWGTMADDGAGFIGYPTNTSNRTTAVSSILGNHPTAASAALTATALFPLPTSESATTLDVFNLTSHLATDADLRCIDQASIYSAVLHGVFPPGKAFYYQFDRSYQLTTYNPNRPLCDAPVTSSHPLGDPSLPYYKCHAGDLMIEFGTLNQFGLGFRDEYDLPFVQLVVDYWSSFIRTRDPNPDEGYLAVRGYTNTSAIVKSNGAWVPVTGINDTLRRLDYPGVWQDSFQDVAQCELIDLPIDYYE